MNKHSHRNERPRGAAPRTARRGAAPPAATLSAASPPAPTRTALPEDAIDLSAEERHAMIAVAAYFHAEARGFAPGLELEDWLAAEREIEHALLRTHARSHRSSDGSALE
jgi:hypothetical protein